MECARCQGTGRVPLSQAHALTLSAVLVGWVSTNDIASQFPSVRRTALNMRLTWLEKRGLIESRWVNGKSLEWRRKL